MRKVIKFIDIILIAIVLTIFTLCKIVSSFALSESNAKKVLKDNGIYTRLNNDIKDSIKRALKNSYRNIPTLDIDDLVEKTITEEVLEKEFDYTIKELYSSGKLYIDSNILSDGYSNNLNQYLAENNIDLPDNIREEINQLMTINSIGTTDVQYFNDNYSKYFILLKDTINKVETFSLVSFIILLVLTIVLSKEKIRGIYIPLILTGINVIVVSFVAKIFVYNQNIFPREQILLDIIDSIKKALFTQLNLVSTIFIVVGIVLMIIKIILRIKANKRLELEAI